MARVMTGKKLKETRFWYIMSELNRELFSNGIGYFGRY